MARVARGDAAAFFLDQKCNAALLLQMKPASCLLAPAESAGRRFGMKYCLVREGVTIQDCSRDSLHRRHRHISSDDMEVLLRRGFVEWLSKPRGVLRFVKRFCKFQLHAPSSRYGEFLANAIRRREGWALIVQGEMRRSREGSR
jgi:hypothetical protein